jgi:hypothetical protein
MAEATTRAVKKPGAAWLVVAVHDDDVALLTQSARARILTRELADEEEIFEETERAEESSVEDEAALAEVLLTSSADAPQPPIHTSVGEEAVLAVLEHDSTKEMFVIVPDQLTIDWLSAHGQGDRTAIVIDDIETVAEPFVKEHANEPLESLRARAPEDALARAMQTGSRAFWALNADIHKDKHGVTERNRQKILEQAREATPERGA